MPIQPHPDDTAAPYAAGMTQQPFFDPWPEPEEHEHDQPEYDIPWMPPRHVVGVTVPLDVEIFTGPDVVVRATRARAYSRGLEIEVETWVRPGATRPVDDVAHVWEQQEPRVGVRLADGTRLGHRPPHVAPDDDAGPSTLAQTGGQGDALRSSRSWWLHPFPTATRSTSSCAGTTSASPRARPPSLWLRCARPPPVSTCSGTRPRRPARTAPAGSPTRRCRAPRTARRCRSPGTTTRARTPGARRRGGVGPTIQTRLSRSRRTPPRPCAARSRRARPARPAGARAPAGATAPSRRAGASRARSRCAGAAGR